MKDLSPTDKSQMAAAINGIITGMAVSELLSPSQTEALCDKLVRLWEIGWQAGSKHQKK